MAKNVYGELFEQLPIPERLSPENIAKMLDEHMEANATRKHITVSESSDSNKRTARPRSATYRAIMSVAACAILVLGLIRFTADDTPALVTTEPTPGSYASDYDDIHKTFQKYYVDDEENKTLDSAIAEIEHSYNEAERGSQTDDEVKEPEITTGATTEAEATDTPATDTSPTTSETPDIDEVPEEEEEEIIETPENSAVLPNIDGFSTDHGILSKDGRIFIHEGDSLKVFNTQSGISFETSIQVVTVPGEVRTLADFFVIGDRLAVVYNVETTETVTLTEEPEGDSVLDELLGDAYEATAETVIGHYAEVRLYQLTQSGAFEIYSQSQSGRLISAVEKNGSVYMVTDYNDYRLAPIVGVEDLDSYVPIYTVNGEKKHIEAGSILLPAKITTTDYTVISGVNSYDLVSSVQALLGYEGRVIVTDEAVYIFGYEADHAVGGTSVEIFSLEDGVVSHKGFTVIDGLALSGAGITVMEDAILVSTVSNSGNVCTTTVRAYDYSLEIMAKVDFPGLFTNVRKEGTKLFYTGETLSYGVDFADPAQPVLVDDFADDVTDYLVAFEDGYVTLTDRDGALVLSKVIEDVNGNLTVCSETEIYTGTFTSKALENNDVMFTDGSLVGVPYGYFDGLDYCYTYALYKSTSNGFELVGTFEAHETDTAFELGKAVSVGESLYLFSDGRIYQLTANESVLAPVNKVDLIYSTYSGHSGF